MSRHAGFTPADEDLDLPELPYNGTSGWSGTDTSRDRALDADRSGTTSRRQRIVLTALSAAGHYGRTWRELADETAMHHGQVSGALTVLHKAHRLARLTEQRNRCRVYVLPDYVGGRDSEPYVPRVQPASVEEMQETIREAYAVMTALGVFDDE